MPTSINWSRNHLFYQFQVIILQLWALRYLYFATSIWGVNYKPHLVRSVLWKFKLSCKVKFSNIDSDCSDRIYLIFCDYVELILVRKKIELGAYDLLFYLIYLGNISWQVVKLRTIYTNIVHCCTCLSVGMMINMIWEGPQFSGILVAGNDEKMIIYPARARSAGARRACALRALDFLTGQPDFFTETAVT